MDLFSRLISVLIDHPKKNDNLSRIVSSLPLEEQVDDDIHRINTILLQLPLLARLRGPDFIMLCYPEPL